MLNTGKVALHVLAISLCVLVPDILKTGAWTARPLQDGANMLSQYTGNQPPTYTAQHPRRVKILTALQLKPEILKRQRVLSAQTPKNNINFIHCHWFPSLQ